MLFINSYDVLVYVLPYNSQRWQQLEKGMTLVAYDEIVLSGHIGCTALPILERGKFLCLLFTVDSYYSSLEWYVIRRWHGADH